MHLGMIVILITGNRRIGQGKCNEDDNLLPSDLEAQREARRVPHEKLIRNL